KFNIRTTFDKLQNNVQNQKTVDLINTLQKKILNEDSNYNRGYSSSINDVQKKMDNFVNNTDFTDLKSTMYNLQGTSMSFVLCPLFLSPHFTLHASRSSKKN
ncbi:MAG: hypothetical protein IJ910_10820, partial [Bacteroidaceae bacterium]|nr:hypothetical protein [Bacteroidaceae bacterium]